MHIKDLNGKSICILGFGREGQAMLKALEEHAPGCEITIADKKEQTELPATSYQLQVGPGWLKNLEKFDVLIKSPGIPPSEELAAYSIKLTSPTQIFFDSIKDSGATVIGVTGSKGKSTTASLLFHILRTSQRANKPTSNVFLVGNIGEPAIAHVKDASPAAIFVMEMSSYQLMNLTVSPHFAVVTVFFPEHLDYHGSVEAYKEAKKHITRFQTKEDKVFFAADSAGAVEIAKESKGKRIPFSVKDAPVKPGETKLLGSHNLSNIAAAFAVSQEFKIPRDIAIAAIKSFQPLPHRLQSIGVIGGIEWVDDSISTTPQSAIAALNALGDRVTTIILGGQDRGYDFAPLAERLKKSKVQTVILLPESGKRIQESLEKTGVRKEIIEAKTMQEAVAQAKQSIKLPIANRQIAQSSIVLLSPASPSYGMFVNFEDRGNQFHSCIKQQ
ncbi:MAG: UDP-N-acetylmuramoyl-L-alanine--D-glutamate ligase [Candidatus Peribacteraceae bacterium]|nr:UDP-N-acetylmuramoyl-L-alanine--D-glutamate ligase [Candidatus Peribacteraceae bacterium]